MQLRAGQVYEYETRPDEKGSRVVVCRVGAERGFGEVAHVCVEGVRIENPAAPGGVTTVVSHLPFDAHALSECLVALVDERSELPDFEEGYALWREAFDAGEAGVFTVSVADALNAVTGMG
ncbi:MAG: hypothetical protein AAFU73_01005 [Planctomycetota bacterium]